MNKQDYIDLCGALFDACEYHRQRIEKLTKADPKDAFAKAEIELTKMHIEKLADLRNRMIAEEMKLSFKEIREMASYNV